MGHTESAACLLPGPSASWLPTPFPAPGTHSPAALSFCTPGSPHSQFVPSQGGLARSVASGSSLAPGILKLRRVVAVSPGAHLSLTWQGTLPAGLSFTASQALPVPHLHSSTPRWDFPRPLQSSSSAVIFRMFGSGSAQRTHELVITWILHTRWVFFAPEHILLSQSFLGFFP